MITDSIGDVISDLLAAFGPKDYAKNYAGEAFGGLLKNVADYASAQGLGGNDVVVSGHSLGGLRGQQHGRLERQQLVGVL